MTEDWFRQVFVQPMKGVEYLNQKLIMHCDLKEENIMVATKSHWYRPSVVLVDFDLASNSLRDGSKHFTPAARSTSSRRRTRPS